MGDCMNTDYWYNNGEGITMEDVDKEEFRKVIDCIYEKTLTQQNKAGENKI